LIYEDDSGALKGLLDASHGLGGARYLEPSGLDPLDGA
jgi:hypothetical protein